MCISTPKQRALKLQVRATFRARYIYSAMLPQRFPPSTTTINYSGESWQRLTRRLKRRSGSCHLYLEAPAFWRAPDQPDPATPPSKILQNPSSLFHASFGLPHVKFTRARPVPAVRQAQCPGRVSDSGRCVIVSKVSSSLHGQLPCPGLRRPWRCHATTLGPREDTQKRDGGGRTGLGGGRSGGRVGRYVVISSPEIYTILGATILALSELIALAPPTSLLAAPATAAPAAVVPRHRADTCPAPDKRGAIAARAPLRRRIPARDTIAKTARSYLEAFQLFTSLLNPNGQI